MYPLCEASPGTNCSNSPSLRDGANILKKRNKIRKKTTKGTHDQTMKHDTNIHEVFGKIHVYKNDL